MHFEDLATELVLEVFRSCSSIGDVLSLAATCRRFRTTFTASQKLPILAQAAEAEYGPLQEAIRLATHNDSQSTHVIRHVPISMALLGQLVSVGRVAKQWEDIYPAKKWKHNFEERRLLTSKERYALRRAIYRLWLYGKAFHNRNHPRTSRGNRSVLLERAGLLLDWTTTELAEMADVREVMRSVLQTTVCPSNGTVQRKFRKRFPETDTQLMFNIHLNYPPPPSHFQQYFHTTHQVTAANKYFTKYQPTAHHEPGAEGWGDEVPHYYVVEDMLKLAPDQILWLREHAPLKGQVEAYTKGIGEWFENNGETFLQTLEWVVEERCDEMEDIVGGIERGEMGIARG